ncbi:hypothetical protein BGZ54_008495 [Gamsiella multidivaricata]|nr:hypothetical protein BGZ54_008495 [Gamsiella multidivaricata]
MPLRLVALLLASLLYHHQQPSKGPTEILDEFGLRLNKDLSAFPLLEEVLQDRSAHSDNGQPRMTLDYSALLTTVRPDDWPVIQFRKFIRLKQLPESMLQDRLPGSYSQSNGNSDEEMHSIRDQTNQDYREEIERSIARMMLQFNAEYIKEVLFDVTVAKDTFLPLADRMASLRTMYIIRNTTLPDDQLQPTIAFIHRNQSTFPSKPLLKLDLESGWSNYALYPSAPALDGESEVQRVKRIRESMWSFAKPKLQLYEAVGHPSMMRKYRIPGFYSRIAQYKIGLDRLQIFSDSDEDQLDSDDEEVIAMQRFFQQCTSLERLDFSIGCSDAFAWAAKQQEQQQEQQHWRIRTRSDLLHAQPILGQLKRLSLDSNRSCHYLIYAANDALVAFRNSLQSIVLAGYVGFDASTLQSPEYIEYRDSLQANRFGDFEHSLPYLTDIDINLTTFPTIRRIGSFSQCPALQSLRIEFGTVIFEPQRRQTRPIIPYDPNVDLELSLFPKWNLPQLRCLMLQGAAALRFDYESLESMIRLEKLVLKCKLWTSLDRYIWRIPRLSAHLASLNADAKDDDISDLLKEFGFGGDNGISGPAVAIPSDIQGSKWTKTWTLPCLKTLVLAGPQVCIFDFTWLDDSSLLEELNLTLEGPPRSLPPIPSLAPRSTSPGDSPIDETSTERELLLPKLRRLFLQRWIISFDDFTRLLSAVAGPNLQSIDVGILHPKSTLTGPQFVQAIHALDAQKIFQEQQQRAGEKKAAASLQFICADVDITEEDTALVGLTPIPESEAWGLYLAQYKKRVYSLATGYFVRDEDVINDDYVEEEL